MENLRILREQQGLLQKEVAQQIGVDRTTYTKYEKGSSEPSFEILLKLSDLFNVSTDYLLGNKKRPTPVSGDGLGKKQRMVYERLTKLTPENLEIAIGQLDVLLTLQEKRDKH